MPRIAVLASTVADQIAAGEVVERPASAVKELVENALDAGATDVDIDVEDGGRALIRVSDDGIGMDDGDAVLALSRHATSKIVQASDLVGVASYGFRGEALPAIASVSRLELSTATADGEGTTVRSSGGVIDAVTQAARRRGTTVSVSQLFFNTPARQKFLRSARSEWRAIADTIVTMALVRRDVRFRVRSDGRDALTLAPAPSLRARVGSIWGAPYVERFVDVDGVSGTVHVRGLVERPADAGMASRRAFVIVNGRPVRDTGVARAVEGAYRSTLPAGLRPSFILELTVPAQEVDVNVHPAKAEVRFHNRWAIERAIEHVVQRALGTSDAAPWVGRPWAPGQGAMLPPPSSLPMPSRTGDADGLFAVEREHDVAASPANASDHAATNDRLDVPDLVQLRRTWMLYEHEEGVILVDQHSAHERVLYERFLGAIRDGLAPSQRLLFPETVHLAPEDADVFEENAELLRRVGYEVESFGGHTLIVHAVPVPHPRFDAIRCLRESLAALSGGREAATHARHEQLAATVACKAAIKAGDALSQAEMQALFRALAGVALPAHDVHGRSTIVRLSWDELERRFGRR
ncbi:MAG: DNA mismatch repair endonuclease MutL [Gemmatimonadaceae bacterium]|nr:DNA mismatch repair endonuclease MutL [Gemmatimonadaceae bacterium]